MEQRKAKIGVGIVTYQRPEYYRVAMESVQKHLEFVDEVVSYHDGPLGWGYPALTPHGETNRGVAYAKNQVIKQLLGLGCDYIFIMEDDMEIIDRKAVIGYLAAYKLTNMPHLNFHGHGDNLYGHAISQDGPLAYWPNCVGAWSFYTRKILETVGPMDEHFINAYEHVEHSWRIYRGHINFGSWPDVVGSENWIRAQLGALENSSIRDEGGDWRKRITAAIDYWKSIDPDCPADVPDWVEPLTKEKK